MDAQSLLIGITVWLGAGALTAAWLVRRGHDRRWLLVSLLLGPLFVPIALERAERGPRVASGAPTPGSLATGGRGAGGTPHAGQGPRLVVGLDGSLEGDRALTEALRLFGGGIGELVVVEVVSHDAVDDDVWGDREAAAGRLEAAVARARARGIAAESTVLAGRPAHALRQFALDADADLLVVGRRGRGRSPHLLGSVTSELVRRSGVPVLVVEPAVRAAAAHRHRVA